MAKNKTAETAVSVIDFINSFVNNDQKKADSFLLIDLMSKWSGCKPKMWGTTIIGFGNYHYKYALLLVFPPEKLNFLFMYFHQHKTINIY